LQSAQQAGDIITGAGIDYDRGNVSPTEWDLRCDELAHWNRLNEVDSAVFSQRAKSGMFGGLDQEKSACYAKQSLRTPSRLAIFGVEKYFNPLFCMNKAVSVQALNSKRNSRLGTFFRTHRLRKRLGVKEANILV
jgi:hypothetical protein